MGIVTAVSLSSLAARVRWTVTLGTAGTRRAGHTPYWCTEYN